jgi:hypothetical protein
MDFAFHEDSGENLGGFSIEREVSDVIQWEFTSTSDVDLLIIKKSTLEYYERVATELSANWHSNYDVLMRQFLEKFYVSRGNKTDSGNFEVYSSGLHYIKFSTSGTIDYIIKCDPFSIDLVGVFYIFLGLITTIGIISYVFKFMKLATKKYKSGKDITKSVNQTELLCERCGALCDSDSVFCYECGAKLKNYILNRIS